MSDGTEVTIPVIVEDIIMMISEHVQEVSQEDLEMVRNGLMEAKDVEHLFHILAEMQHMFESQHHGSDDHYRPGMPDGLPTDRLNQEMFDALPGFVMMV
jgi:hypothetical protein